MNSTLIAVAITALVVAAMVYRNATWQSVKIAKLARLPLVFGLVGVLSVVETVRSLGRSWHPSTADVAVLGAEFAVAVTVGWAMGRLSEFRTAGGGIQSRLRPAGVVTFVGFIAVRVLLTTVAAPLGCTAALLSSSVLLVVAVIKLVQVLVLRSALATFTADSAAHDWPAVPESTRSELSHR